MSHLDNILRNIAQPDVVEDQLSEAAVDYVFVEKLASAVDYLLENPDVLKEAMDEGAEPEAKEDETKEPEEGKEKGDKVDKKSRLLALFAKSKKDSKGEKGEKGAPKKGPEVAEAKEEDSEESAEKEASFTEAVDKLRSSLMSKIANEATAKSDGFVDELVARLQDSAPSVETKVAAQTEPEALDDTAAEPSTTEGEETKEASERGSTLASMLLAARSGSTGSTEESTPQGVKTAASQDVSLSGLLKGSLFKKIGQAEVE